MFPHCLFLHLFHAPVKGIDSPSPLLGDAVSRLVSVLMVSRFGALLFLNQENNQVSSDIKIHNEESSMKPIMVLKITPLVYFLSDDENHLHGYAVYGNGFIS